MGGWTYTDPQWIDGSGLLLGAAIGTAGRVYAIKTCLLAAGWTVHSSGDGSSYALGSDLIGDAAALANDNAWFALLSPDGAAGLCMQHHSGAWRVKDGLTDWGGGSPSATQVPASTVSETVRVGGGTDAAPTFTSWMVQSVVYGGADAASPYSFWFADGGPTAVGAPQSVLANLPATGNFPEAPSVTIVSPGPGKALQRDGEVTVDVAEAGGLAFAELTVVYPGGATEVIARDGDFRRPYSGTRSVISGGYRYQVSRDGGWPRGNPRFEAVAIDTSGGRSA